MSKLSLDTVYHVNRQFIQDCELLRKDTYKACEEIYKILGGKSLEKTDPVVATVFRRIEEFENCWGPEVEKIVKYAELEQQLNTLQNEHRVAKERYRSQVENLNFQSSEKHKLMQANQELRDRNETVYAELHEYKQQNKELVDHIKMLEERLELLGGDS